MKYPVILCAPHAQTSIDIKSIRERIRLDDYQIWKCSDPFTDQLSEFTVPWKKHIAKTHRLVCDMNRAPNEKDAFHDKDFFDRTVFYPGQEFTKEEKEGFIEKYWKPYHESIEKSVVQLAKKNPPYILMIDYHNTSTDHHLDEKGTYMPSFVVSNLGKFHLHHEKEVVKKVTIPDEFLEVFAEEVSNRTSVAVEINDVFHGGYNIKFYSQLQKKLKLSMPVFSFQIEYNLDFVVNPISRRVDKKALKMMQKAENEAIRIVCQYLEDYVSEESSESFQRQMVFA